MVVLQSHEDVYQFLPFLRVQDLKDAAQVVDRLNLYLIPGVLDELIEDREEVLFGSLLS